jgi:hypothetical protein
LGIAEQIYDALITWDLLAELEVTQLSLAFFHQFNQHVEVGRSQKCSGVYVHLTDALRNWAEKTLLFIMDHIPDNYVLPMAMDRITTKPTGSQGTIHCLIASLSLYNTYKGLVPPLWYNGGHSTNGRGTPIRGESHDGASLWVPKNIGSGVESQYSTVPDFNHFTGYGTLVLPYKTCNFPTHFLFGLLPYFTSLVILSTSSHATVSEVFGSCLNQVPQCTLCGPRM